MDHTVTIVLTTLPDSGAAQALAEAVLDARLAACVTELAEARSRYRWQGKVEVATEIPVLFKTSAERAPALQQFIAAHHPYDTPEIVSWLAASSPAYASWVNAETSKTIHV